MSTLDKAIRKRLIELSDESTKKSFQRFFKNEVKAHGVKSKNVGIVAKWAISQTDSLTKKEVFELAEKLYKSGYCEEAWIASGLVYDQHQIFEEKDFDIFGRWVNSYIDDWAKCDGFCNHTVGTLITLFPHLVIKLKVWASSPNLWMRRAAAVSLIVPAKEGKFLKESLELATMMLTDKEDMVQKGYGWLLKEQSRKNQKIILDFVVKNKGHMPRTSLRYAIELMPQNLRKIAMEK